MRLVESFQSFIAGAEINQEPGAWEYYGSNPKKVLKSTEKVAFPELGISSIKAKVDTGADGTSIDANDIKIVKGKLTFWTKSPSNRLEFSKFSKVKVKNSSGKTEERYRIKTTIKIGKEEFNIQVSLTNRDKMSVPCILGKNVITKGKFIVDVAGVVENFKEFIDLASINQGPRGWTIYGSNPEDSTLAWYTSWNELSEFKSHPTWFSNTPEDAEARHAINKTDHTYLVRIKGNIFSANEIKQLAKKLKIDFNRLEIELIMNPSIKERRELVEPFIEYCDGFIHRDEDPKNWGKGQTTESILVFDPAQHVEIVEEISY
jgi:hypothetical protein